MFVDRAPIGRQESTFATYVIVCWCAPFIICARQNTCRVMPWSHLSIAMLELPTQRVLRDECCETAVQAVWHGCTDGGLVSDARPLFILLVCAALRGALPEGVWAFSRATWPLIGVTYVAAGYAHFALEKVCQGGSCRRVHPKALALLTRRPTQHGVDAPSCRQPSRLQWKMILLIALPLRPNADCRSRMRQHLSKGADTLHFDTSVLFDHCHQ